MQAGEGNFSLRVDALGLYALSQYTQQLMVLSAVGSGTSTKAFAAALHSTNYVQLDAARCGQIENVRLTRCPEGYVCRKQRLEGGYWHLLALAKDDRLMTRLTDEALYRILSSNRYTTPILRQWTPWLSAKLSEADEHGDSFLVQLTAFQCQPALLLATTDDLDKIVVEGVKAGELRIQP
jgi:hypothetical protein